MEIKINWWRSTGKWYAGDTIEVPDKSYYDLDELMQLVVDRQTALVDGWRTDSFFVTLEGSDLNNDGTAFVNRLFLCTQLWPERSKR